MSPSSARRAVLAIALSCSAAVYAQGQGLQLRGSSQERSKTGALPITLEADRIEGVAGKDTNAQGNARLRRGDLSIRADSLTYHEENEDVEALKNLPIDTFIPQSEAEIKEVILESYEEKKYEDQLLNMCVGDIFLSLRESATLSLV